MPTDSIEECLKNLINGKKYEILINENNYEPTILYYGKYGMAINWFSEDNQIYHDYDLNTKNILCDKNKEIMRTVLNMIKDQLSGYLDEDLTYCRLIDEYFEENQDEEISSNDLFEKLKFNNRELFNNSLEDSCDIELNKKTNKYHKI